MRATTLAMLLFFIFFGFDIAFSADTSDSLTAEIQSLNNELKAVESLENTLLAEKASLKKEEGRLTATKDLLDGAAKNFNAEVDAWKKDLDAHNADAQRQKAAMSSLNSEIAAHNSSCGGTYKDKSYVDSCNSRAGQLNARGQQLGSWGNNVSSNAKRINERKSTLQAKERGLKERYADLQKAVLDWAKRQKENNWQLNELYAKKQILNQRILATLNELARRNQLSQECKKIAESADPNNLNDTRLEQAHRCMQKIWDGAR